MECDSGIIRFFSSDVKAVNVLYEFNCRDFHNNHKLSLPKAGISFLSKCGNILATISGNLMVTGKFCVSILPTPTCYMNSWGLLQVHVKKSILNLFEIIRLVMLLFAVKFVSQWLKHGFLIRASGGSGR